MRRAFCNHPVFKGNGNGIMLLCNAEAAFRKQHRVNAQKALKEEKFRDVEERKER